MKKIILIFVFVSLIVSSTNGQHFSDRFGVNNEHVKEIGQLMKEAFAIHFLMLKNDIDELSAFFSDYNYYSEESDNDNELWFYKLNLDDSNENDYNITIRKPFDVSEDIQNAMEVFFLIPNNPENENMFQYSKYKGDYINTAITANFYESFSRMENWSVCDEPNTKCNITLYKMTDKMLESSKDDKKMSNFEVSEHGISYTWLNDNGNTNFIYRYSNFLSLAGEGDDDGLKMFTGPGNTLISIKKSVRELNNGSYNTMMTLISYYNDNMNPSDFNYKEFMAFDLDMRIWGKDKKQ
ncbi:MAG: hypothetical protein CMC04_04600 [Flavobacteriaceae bacterium]|nr:hypothetical protein [Flavobacteriaceae bacterium]|tara:strand:- start:2357 stop:3241 length:885 start_codon:yes stop_codon:yes gene_type:complete